MSNLCRLCALEKPHLIPTFGAPYLDIVDNISKLLSITINKTDNLPKSICTECFIKLNSFHEFTMNANKAQHVLKLLFENNSDKMDSVSINRQFMATNYELDVIEVKPNVTQHGEFLLKNIFNINDNMNRPGTSNDTINEMKYNPQANQEHERLLHNTPTIIIPTTSTSNNDNNMDRDNYINSKSYDNSRMNSPIIDKYMQKNIPTSSPSNLTTANVNHLKLTDNRIFTPQIILQNQLSITPNNEPADDKSFQNDISLYHHKKFNGSSGSSGGVDGIKYACDVCGKEFRSSITVLQHKKAKHLKIKDEICQVCGKGFASKPALRYHLKTHSEDYDKNNQCNICGKYFKTQTILRTHLAVHSDTKLYNCEMCTKKFKTKNALSMHKKLHQNT